MREMLGKPSGRTEEDKEADLAWIAELFDGVEYGQLTCITVYLIQILKEIDPGSTVYLLNELAERIMFEQMTNSIPPQIKKFLENFMAKEEN